MGLIPRPRVCESKSIIATLADNNELIAAETGASILLTQLVYSNRDASPIDVSFRWGEAGAVFYPTYMLQGSIVALNLLGTEKLGPEATALNVLLSGVGDVLVTASYLVLPATFGA